MPLKSLPLSVTEGYSASTKEVEASQAQNPPPTEEARVCKRGRAYTSSGTLEQDSSSDSGQEKVTSGIEPRARDVKLKLNY